MKEFKRLLLAIKQEWLLFLLGITLLIISTILLYYCPRLISDLLDYLTQTIQSHGSFETGKVLQLLTIYLILSLLAVTLSYLSRVLTGIGSNRIVCWMRDQAYARMQSLPVSFFDDKPAGKIASRIVNDTETIRLKFYQTFSTQILLNFTKVIGAYLALFYTDYRIAIPLLILIPVFIYWQQFYSKLVKPINQYDRESSSEINSATSELVQGISLIQSFNQEEHVEQQFSKLSQSWLTNRLKYLKIEATLEWSLSNFIKIMVMVCFIAYIMAVNTQGNLVYSVGKFYLVMNYIMMLFDPLTNMVYMNVSLQQALVAAHRVFELLDSQIEEDPDSVFQMQEGSVVFDHVCFAYQADHPVLKEINFRVESGQTVALVGTTGSGKSSLMNLLMRFYDPQRGRILIDGQDIKDFSRESVRDQMGIVLQEPYLFTGTVAENIRRYHQELTDDQLVEALRRVGGGPLLAKLDQGIHTPLAERGQSLSSGERQLIAFARTLVNDPKILVLDEATSHIDTQTERIIQNAMKVLQEGRTTFIIAHRLSTILHADLILVLDKGQIVERGDHQSLLELDGFYADIYNKQTQMAQSL